MVLIESLILGPKKTRRLRQEEPNLTITITSPISGQTQQKLQTPKSKISTFQIKKTEQNQQNL